MSIFTEQEFSKNNTSEKDFLKSDLGIVKLLETIEKREINERA